MRRLVHPKALGHRLETRSKARCPLVYPVGIAGKDLDQAFVEHAFGPILWPAPERAG
jgi:hypothetical protein